MTLLPWITTLVTTIYDPLSLSHTTNLVTIVTELLNYDPTPIQLAPLLKEIYNIFRSYLLDICIPVIRSGCSVTGIELCISQLKKISKIVYNISLFNTLLSPIGLGQLCQLVLDRCTQTMTKLLTSTTQFPTSTLLLEVVYILIISSYFLL